MSRKVNIFNVLSAAPACADVDVQAFLAATGISDATTVDALCVLVTTAKSQGWYSKLQTLYPFVGGTATTHKFNLKDPQDLDSAFRLQFLGGWTHSSNGALPNGINGYARTYWNSSVRAAANSVSFGLYSRTNVTGANYIYGSFVSAGTKRMWHNFNGNIQIADGSQITYTANPSTRMFISYRDSNVFNQSFRDGVSLGSLPSGMITLPNTEFYLGALSNSGTASFFTQHEIAFAFMGNALTGTDVANITAAVNTFQTSLGRNV